MRYYLHDLFPKGQQSFAQIPYLYSREFNEKLDKITKEGRRVLDADGRLLYYELD